MVLDGKSSQEYPINAGVPQASIIGPTLFLLYIIDLPDDVICNFAIYADDTSTLARKLKWLMFSQNWEIRVVFTKCSYHGWQQENIFWYNVQNAGKRNPGKEIFQSMTLYNTHKSPLRNVFFFVYDQLGWDMG